MRKWVGWTCAAVAIVCAPRSGAAQATGARVDSTTVVTREVRSLGFSIEAVDSAAVPSGARKPGFTLGKPGRLADFKPEIAAFGENGTCENIPMDDGTMVLLAFENGPEGAKRNVSVTFSPSGEPLRYSDIRGDLESPTGARTGVTVDLRGGPATGLNLNTASPSVSMGSSDEAMDLPNLGNPRAMIEQIKRQCGTGSK